ncbi:alpha/beta fold hydrolase [Actinoalloteichus caeruleus]|uniref:alpha/beta fold hydrolase n=1 Tax=Actinoalloteichus cyanogriseus TaxID=2893586 RepID=UPI0004AA1EA4|nr:alpha/beta hydrolase [Actinoalloteichus caeruleus]
MGHYARIGDVLTWYDDHGAGEPLLLLHGGLGDSRDFDGLLDDLTPHFRVLRPERRGHGRSPDAPGPTGYASMAGDTIRFLEDVVGGPAHLLGHGDGGTVALLTAIRRPDLVRRAVLVGAVFHHEGLVPELRAALAEHGVGRVPAPLALAHEEVSPHGAGHAQDLWERLMTMMSNEPALRREDLAGADVPVLVMSGDRDVVSLEHSVALYRGLPTASLAILPEATRSLIAEHPGLCGRIAGDFLRGATAPG